MARAKTAAIARAQAAHSRVSLTKPPPCARAFILLKDRTTDEICFMPLRCKKWSCDYCAAIRRAQLEYDIRSGHAQRFMTLTLRPRSEISLSDRVAFLRKSFRTLLKVIRHEWGPMEYASVIELQENGSPHLHILQRGCYISQQWLSRTWLALTGAWHVNIKRATNTRASAHELSKYLAATAIQLGIAGFTGKIFTFSKHWRIDKTPRDPAYAERDWQTLWCPHSFTDLNRALGSVNLALVPAGSFSMWKAEPRPPPTDKKALARQRINSVALDPFLLTLAHNVAQDPANLGNFIDLEEALRHPEWLSADELVSDLDLSLQDRPDLPQSASSPALQLALPGRGSAW